MRYAAALEITIGTPPSLSTCSIDLAKRMMDAAPSSDDDAVAADHSQAQQHSVQPADSPADEHLCLHTSVHSAIFAPRADELSLYRRGMCEPLPGDHPRRLQALARQGRRILAHRDAVVRAEAAATAGDSASSSVPWWRKWQQELGSAQPSSSMRWQRMAENAVSWWRNGLLNPGLLLPDDQSEPEVGEEPFRLAPAPLAVALAIMKAHPEHAFLQPDLEQARSAVCIVCTRPEMTANVLVQICVYHWSVARGQHDSISTSIHRCKRRSICCTKLHLLARSSSPSGDGAALSRTLCQRSTLTA